CRRHRSPAAVAAASDDGIPRSTEVVTSPVTRTWTATTRMPAAARWRSAGRATVMGVSGGEERDGVPLTNLDQPLFDGARATKRDLVDYLDAVSGHLLPELSGRPLTVVRVLRGQSPFMQKNLPRYAPDWVRRVRV